MVIDWREKVRCFRQYSHPECGNLFLIIRLHAREGWTRTVQIRGMHQELGAQITQYCHCTTSRITGVWLSVETEALTSSWPRPKETGADLPCLSLGIGCYFRRAKLSGLKFGCSPLCSAKTEGTIIIIITYLSWSWASCWLVPVSRIQKSAQRRVLGV